jgi:hypothetical protein
MTGIWRIVAAIRQFTLPVVALAVAATVLSGCDSFKRAVGIEKSSPDEFAVESRAPLTIPPDFDLRPPAPGASRPQEVSAASKAQSVIDSAQPGEPGKQEAGTLHMPSTGPHADATSQVADESLSAKLLQTADTDASVVVEKRQTSVLEGVH